MNSSSWRKRRVLVTGHTGFKGGWLSLWLHAMGAEVHGIALEPPTEPNFYTETHLHMLFASDIRQDIRQATQLCQHICAIQPDFVFHLAAQPLVQYSYDHPLETYEVNVLGTANVLEAIRKCSSVQAALIITTDKCYENNETGQAYTENDRLGGKDPYSSSKACAELVTDAYRSSYFSAPGLPIIATARAGNVIGGGDWAVNRLIPDCVRAYVNGATMHLRYPHAIRPWQHVLESIHGYLMLGEQLLSDAGGQFAEAWNFGPAFNDMRSVGEVARAMAKQFAINISVADMPQSRHEAGLLKIDSSKAITRLNWYPRWSLDDALTETATWYLEWRRGGDMLAFSRSQIQRFLQLLPRSSVTTSPRAFTAAGTSSESTVV